jgi:hypothetical protein
MSLLNAKIANKTSSIVENDRNQAKVDECRTSAIEFSEQLGLLSELRKCHGMSPMSVCASGFNRP